MILCQLEQTAVPKENLNNSSLCTYLNTWLKNLNLKCTRQAKGSAFHIFINNANAGCVKSVQAIKYTPHKSSKWAEMYAYFHHTFTSHRYTLMKSHTPPFCVTMKWDFLALEWFVVWLSLHFTSLGFYLLLQQNACFFICLLAVCFYPVQSQSLQRVFLTRAISRFACACLIYEKPEQLAYFYNKKKLKAACTSGITSFFINTGSI